MKKIFKFLSVAAFGAVLLNACQKDSSGNAGLSSEEKEMKAIVDQYVPNVIQTIYGHLADETQTLYEQLDALKEAFKANPDQVKQADVDQVCTTFLQARAYWEASEAFLYGAATDFGIDPHIDTWPLNRTDLANSLSNKSIVEALDEDVAVGNVGESSLGFHGIEFILFREGKNRTVAALKGTETAAEFAGKDVTGREELIFATAVAADLRDKCFQLEVSWNEDAPEDHVERVEEAELPCTLRNGNSYGKDMLSATEPGSTYATFQEAISSILVDGCSNIAQEVGNTKMGEAFRGDDPNYIESPYSKKSFQDFKDNILSCQYSLYGAFEAKSAGSHSIMKFLQDHNAAQAKALQSTLEGALAALDACLATGVAFVDAPQATYVGEAINAINAFDAELNKTAEWVVKQ